MAFPRVSVRHVIWTWRAVAALGLAALLGAGIFAKRGYLDWAQMRAKNAELEAAIGELSRQRAALDNRMERFERDPRERERLVRSSLGYLKRDETAVEFGDADRDLAP
jgi:cell division protein FtsB